ncbi:MAG: MoaD/ThiS family protein [Proteobacteria bacterium]|nr:MoaD/ThiS family protein [Pseudomonadota bacterium]
MARVVLPGDLARRFAGGQLEVSVDADNVRALIRALDGQFPGIAEVLSDDNIAVAIDGDICQDPLLEPVGPDAEVFFLPAIRGG